MNNVSKIIGQELAIEQAKGIFNHLEHLNGEPIKPRLIHGPSGTGKTHLINALIDDLLDLGIETTRIDDCGALLIQSGAGTQPLIDAFERSQYERVALVTDEVHKIIKGSKTMSAMERDICQFIMPNGDYMRAEITGKINGKECTANFRNLIWIAATNEKDSLETRESLKKGEAPVARRFSEIEMTRYNQGEMEQIIPSFFAKNGFTISDCASQIVLKLHRGNMEALVQVMDRIKQRVFGKKTVNREEVISACKLTSFLPRGLTKGEARLLERLTRQDLTDTRAQAVLGSNIKITLNHLSDQYRYDDKGEKIYTPLVNASTAKIKITDAGRIYLKQCADAGFSW